MNTNYNINSVTIADLCAIEGEMNGCGQLYGSFLPYSAVNNIKSALERYNLIMQKLENARKPIRASEISANSDWNHQAIVPILNKLCAAGIVRRVVLETRKIEIIMECSKWVRVDDTTKKFVPAGTPLTVPSEIIGFELVR